MNLFSSLSSHLQGDRGYRGQTVLERKVPLRLPHACEKVTTDVMFNQFGRVQVEGREELFTEEFR